MKNTSIRRTAAALAIGGAVAATMSMPAANAVDGATWDALAQCESGGNWSINTGNGFYGGLQFTQQSWNGVGMSGSPATATRAQQIEAGERLLAIQGWGAWPACSAKLGLYGKTGAAPTYTEPTTTVAAQSQTQQTYTAPAAQAAPAAPAAQAAPAAVEAPAAAPAAPAVEAPAAPAAAPAAEAPVAAAPVAAPKAAAGTYTVVPGDSLSLIAAKLGVAGGYQAIAAANTDIIYNVDLIFPGQVLTIPA
ncbi:MULTISPECIES: transglycosylase family protein [unclassified Rothia (in: high G+C Gram-positive bacteria)]|uniref:transglycosylase family protein n=1 Tax=unclassified Rothia (in: high G+C Gram-positive bacteria) TaxID=2689056 RepID=UPI0008A1D1CE|nr:MULTISPECIES: transglycosylase family protein [unclassified Rothia (in: high G+C Gram-positive bacteria)]OFJ97717.1 transglycosylase [Rothia sp. HMSC065C12]OHP54443.1 transglycosylase [Rothia sp. HMSC061D12]